jgi:hypothetical protein
MKTYKVYEIINSMGIVEHVGETSRSIKSRMYDHKRKPVEGQSFGKFYGRNDIIVHQVAEFNSRKEARNLEGQLKLEYGLEWTEKVRDLNNCSNGGITSTIIERTCICGLTIKGPVYFLHIKKCNKIT